MTQATPLTSLGRLLHTERPPTQIVALDTEGARTWADFLHDVGCLVPRLQEHRQQRWALYLEDAYAFAVGLWGLWHAGKIVVLPPNAQPGTLMGLSAHVDGLLSQHPLPGDWIQLSPLPDGSNPTSYTPTSSQMTATLDRPLLPQECLLELFTSGTTGQTKCIPKQLSQLDAEVAVLHQVWGQKIDSSCFFSTVSQQHIYGLLFRVCWPLAAGRPMWRHNLLFPAHLFETMAQYTDGMCTLIATPAHYDRLLSWLALAPGTPVAAKLAALFSSGGPLHKTTANQLAAALGQAPFEVLGSSETGGIATRQQEAEGIVHWRPLPQVEIQVTEEQTLCVRSPWSPVGKDGWYHTGDCATLVTDGGFQLLGRRDRIVKIAEQRLSLHDMEIRLLAHPFVASCAILMTTHPHQKKESLGSLVVLTKAGQVYLAQDGHRETHALLRQHLEQHFERVLLPKRWRFVDEIPQDAQGKRVIAALRALFADTNQDEQAEHDHHDAPRQGAPSQ